MKDFLAKLKAGSKFEAKPRQPLPDDTAINSSPPAAVAATPIKLPPVRDDLDIPDFLRRKPLPH